MNGIQDRFIVRTFAIGLVSVFIMMGAALFGAIFYFGDGEAFKIIADLTAPFLGLAAAITAAFLGQHATNMWAVRRAFSGIGGGQADIVQDWRYNVQQWALKAPAVPYTQIDPQGPLGARVAAQAASQGAPAPQAAQESEGANGH